LLLTYCSESGEKKSRLRALDGKLPQYASVKLLITTEVKSWRTKIKFLGHLVSKYRTREYISLPPSNDSSRNDYMYFNANDGNLPRTRPDEG